MKIALASLSSLRSENASTLVAKKWQCKLFLERRLVDIRPAAIGVMTDECAAGAENGKLGR